MGLPAVWAMTTQPWLMDMLQESGFSGCGRVVAFSRQAHQTFPEGEDGISVVEMREADLSPVEQLDHLAFLPPWQIDSDALRVTFERSMLAIVHRSEDRVTGYLMAGAAPQGLHITRIAVHPEYQRKGIGRGLLIRLLDFGRRRGALRFTVNTQHDNHRSRKLYRSLGFYELGESYPVFRFDLPSGHK